MSFEKEIEFLQNTVILVVYTGFGDDQFYVCVCGGGGGGIVVSSMYPASRIVVKLIIFFLAIVVLLEMCSCSCVGICVLCLFLAVPWVDL